MTSEAYAKLEQEGWVHVCRLADLVARRGRRARVSGVDVAIFRTSHDAILAVEDRCPHKGGPLSEGIVTDECVTCPLHGWKVSLVTGGALAPDKGRARTIPTFVDLEGEVWARLAPVEAGVPLVPIEDVTGVHPDNKRPKLGHRRATPEDFSVHDFDREVPVLAVEPPSPDDDASLRLRITDPSGAAEVLAMADLKRRFPIVRVPTHVTCLMFGFTRKVTWTGVRLWDVLGAAPVTAQPFYSFYSWETDATREKRRFFETLPRGYVEDPRTMLVFGMNDGPLPKEHGGPLRLVVPFLQGYKSVKWLTWIKACETDEIGYKKLFGFIDFPELAAPEGWRAPWKIEEKSLPSGRGDVDPGRR
jgi:nitrite reductase (NADH) small subunit